MNLHSRKQPVVRAVWLGLFLLWQPRPAISQPDRRFKSDLIVRTFNAQGRTLDVLKALAEQSRVPIGISGVLIGSDSKQISVVREQTSVRAILNEICQEDQRFSWSDTRDGNIGVEVGRRHLDLIDVRAATTLQNIKPFDVTNMIVQLPEVVSWSQADRCEVGQAIAIVRPMGSKPKEWKYSIKAQNLALWELLNQLSLKAETYFWSVIKYSENPCIINLQPLLP